MSATQQSIPLPCELTKWGNWADTTATELREQAEQERNIVRDDLLQTALSLDALSRYLHYLAETRKAQIKAEYPFCRKPETCNGSGVGCRGEIACND